MRAMKLLVVAAVLCVPVLIAQGPTVYISGDNGVSASSSGFALGGLGMAGSSVAKHDKTSAMARALLKSCPEVSLTLSVSDSHPDYLLLLYREESSFGGGSSNQVMVLRPDKSVVFASKEGSVSKSTREGCKAIMADWKDRRPRAAHVGGPNPNWNTTKP